MAYDIILSLDMKYQYRYGIITFITRMKLKTILKLESRHPSFEIMFTLVSCQRILVTGTSFVTRSQTSGSNRVPVKYPQPMIPVKGIEMI